jgi:transposase
MLKTLPQRRHPRSYASEVKDALYNYMGLAVSDTALHNALRDMGYSHKKRIKSAQEKYNPQAINTYAGMPLPC